MNGIEILDFYKSDHVCGVNNKKYPLPAVAKTYKFFKTHKDSVPFSRKNIFIRDGYTCQYCNKKLSNTELTYDHVVPKVIWDYNSGSPTRWTNIVTSCTLCNKKKGGRTPKQAKMILQNPPYEPDKNPKYLSIVQILSKIHDVPEEWLLYLPKSYTYA